MAYTRPIEWREGEAMCACDICGFPYRYPSEMVYADDKQFYCLRTCWLGKTNAQALREAADAHKGLRETSNRAVGKTPSHWSG